MELNTLIKFSFKNDKCLSIRPEIFCSQGVLRNYAKFTRKHQLQSLFLNQAAGLRPTILF